MPTLFCGHQSSIGGPWGPSRPKKLSIGEPATLSVSNRVVSALPSPTKSVESLQKKALLIGINYPEGSGWHLEGPQMEVKEFRKLLLEQYGYQDANIVVLTDEDDTPLKYLPTRANIIREIMNLTAGSSPGDERVFMFCGHSAQREESKKLCIGQEDAITSQSSTAISQRPTAIAGARLPSSLTLDERPTVQRTASAFTTPVAIQRSVSTHTTSAAAVQRTVSTQTTTTTAAETITLTEEHAMEVELESFMAQISEESEKEEDGYDEYIVPLDAIEPQTNNVVDEKVVIDEETVVSDEEAAIDEKKAVVDEKWVVIDDKVLIDDVLRKCLVAPLCPEAKLVAIFDCCHSATLLDLTHHRCHRIGTWSSRFRRFCRRLVVEPYVWFVRPFKLRVLQEIGSEHRVEGTGDKPETATDATRSKSNLKKWSNGWFNGTETLDKKLNMEEPPLSPLPGQVPRSTLPRRPPLSNPRGQAPLPLMHSSSNVVLNPRKTCTGLCARMDPMCLDRRHVVCISACKDSQMEIEGEEGECQTMTYAIIALLKANPSPTLRELMQAVNANAKKTHKKMKMRYRAYEKGLKARNQPISQAALNKIEHGKILCKNVQNPQMSSSRSLDLRKTYLFAPPNVDPVEGGGLKEGRYFRVLLTAFGQVP